MITSLCIFLASVRSAVDLHAVKSAVGVSKSRQDLNSVLQLVRTPSVGRALVAKLKVKDPLLSKQGIFKNAGAYLPIRTVRKCILKFFRIKKYMIFVLKQNKIIQMSNVWSEGFSKNNNFDKFECNFAYHQKNVWVRPWNVMSKQHKITNICYIYVRGAPNSAKFLPDTVEKLFFTRTNKKNFVT